MIRRTLGFGLWALTLLGAAHAHAQAPASQPRVEEQFNIMIRGSAQAGGPTMLPLPPGVPDIDFMSMPIGVGGETVAGAPYSAEAVTSVVQTLADGNRIVRESKAVMYRDSAGRTRREQGLAIIGALVGGPDDHQQVQITDPQSGSTLVLNMANHTAFKLGMPSLARPPIPPSPPGAGVRTFELAVPAPSAGASGAMFFKSFQGGSVMTLSPPVVEQLGSQNIEGVDAEGTRSTVTIPAGQIGNELPLNIVSERWFSPALKVLVLSRQSDPRFGETTYRLTNIVRQEPAADLFELPSDFTLVEPGATAGTTFRIEKR